MKTRAWCVLLCAGLLGGPAAARAEVISFTGIAGVQSAIPAGYAGFTWDNFNTLNTQAATNVMPSGYQVANTDPASPNVAFNLYGQPASMTSATPFSFAGGYFTAAWRDNLLVDVKGYRNGVLRYDQSFQVSSTAPTFEAFNFQGIDTLTFTTSGGTVHGYNPPGLAHHPPLTQVAMDDLVVDPGGFTPEPSSLTLLGSGVLLAAIPWRRRSADGGRCRANRDFRGATAGRRGVVRRGAAAGNEISSAGGAGTRNPAWAAP